MKPEIAKSILRSYLKEKQHSSVYDDVDGFANSGGNLSGEPFEPLGDRASAFLFMEPQAANILLDDLYVPLPPEIEGVAIGIGRQLSQMSDEFESDHTDGTRSRASSIGNKSVKFKEYIMRVPPTSTHISIPVVRANTGNSVVNVAWRTCDKSAKAGLHYVSNHGNISFVQGDNEKIIHVEIIETKEKKNDICFAIELFDPEGADPESFNTLMVYIIDDSNLYPEEKQVVDNIVNCSRNISLSEVVVHLRDTVTRNTFKVALQCLCSTANSIPKELALASELLRLTLPHARLSMLTNVFCEYFSSYPELDDIVSMF